MKNYKQINEEQREIIQHMLGKGDNFTKIGKSIKLDRTAISKEVKRNRYIKSYHYSEFDVKWISQAVSKCQLLRKPPYVCNGCNKKCNCLNHKLYYNSKIAQQKYKKTLTESRKGINTSNETIDEIEHIIVPLIKNKKQSVNQVYFNHSDILSMSKSTFYKYVNNGVLSLTNTDLPKKSIYKKRKTKKDTNYKRNITILKNRKYEDYLNFSIKHPSMNKVQLDTVIGRISNDKVLLTIYLVETHFMLMFLIDKKTSENVSNVFRNLKNVLGIDLYRKVFRIILTDNGVEFYNPYEMEYNYDSQKKVSNVFYCKPYSSWQKHELELNHRYIRYVFPKKYDFDTLNESSVKRLQDNINCIPRKSINGNTPYNLTKEKFPELIKRLDCQYIKPDDVDLSIGNIIRGEDDE